MLDKDITVEVCNPGITSGSNKKIFSSQCVQRKIFNLRNLGYIGCIHSMFKIAYQRPIIFPDSYVIGLLLLNIVILKAVQFQFYWLLFRKEEKGKITYFISLYF